MDNDADITTRLLLDKMIRNLVCEDEGGGDIDEAADGPAEDEIECYKDDSGTSLVDEDRLEEFLEQEDNEDEAQRNLLLTLMMTCLCEEEENKRVQQRMNENPRPSCSFKKPVIPRTRHAKFFFDPTSGIVRPMTPRLSAWWIYYIQDPEPQSIHWSKMFRSRFRLPYASFQDLIRLINDKGGELFARWTIKRVTLSGDGRRRGGGAISKISPIELLLLGSLRFLGRGWTFDDVQESYFHSQGSTSSLLPQIH